LRNSKASPELFRLLDENLDWDTIIPDTFYRAFYLKTGRKRKYELESFLRALFLQRIFHYVEDTQLLNTLRFSHEMRDFCGFDKVPDASKLTRFKQDFCDHLRSVFERLVDLTEPICREMDKALADTLIFDTTLKDILGVAGRKTSNVLATKADLLLAGIVQLLCVLLAHMLHDAKLARRPRRLIA